ncbi:hypothetical protein [Polaromonas sp.]
MTKLLLNAAKLPDNGSVGDVVDFDDLSRLKAWTRQTRPAAQAMG